MICPENLMATVTSLFKEEIQLMWEDDANKNGDKWIIHQWKGLASHRWENLILAMLGKQFMDGGEICRAVVSVFRWTLY